jgi:cytochrome oxidase assembly protein ShyY1
MKRVPIIPTILVTLAVMTMVALGVWQLQRKTENQMLLKQVSANSNLPPITYPGLGPVSLDALHRKSSVNCLRVSKWREDSGSDKTGKSGTRYLADCVTSAEGPGALIVAGISTRPNEKINWSGGVVKGIITTEPDRQSLFAKLFTKPVTLRPMLVSQEGVGGLRTAQPPSLSKIQSKISNNGFYAIQWFLFALAATIIYVLALRKRLKPS